MSGSVILFPPRGRFLLTAAVWTVMALGLPLAPADVAALERFDDLQLTSDEFATAAVIDPDGKYAYFGTSAFEESGGKVMKIDLATFERVGTLTLESDELVAGPAVIDPAGAFAYFGTLVCSFDPDSICEDLPHGRVVKIDLETFERADALEMESDEVFFSFFGLLAPAVIDAAGRFAYFGTLGDDEDYASRVVKIDLMTFERVGAIELESDGVGGPTSAVIDPGGEYGYFGVAFPFSDSLVKIDLEELELVDSMDLASDVGIPVSAVIDPEGAFAYLGTSGVLSGQMQVPGQVVRIDLDLFEQDGALELESDEFVPAPAVIDPRGRFAYFGTFVCDSVDSECSEPFASRVVEIDLETFETFERSDTLEMESGELFAFVLGTFALPAVIEPTGTFAYFSTFTTGDDSTNRVVKIGLPPVLPAGLEVDAAALGSDGNGVLEPGETVEVAPAWWNTGEPRMVSGTATELTGPGGADYGIESDVASYGLIDADETVSCRDLSICYSVAVEDPAVRPAVHWDATLTETLSDDSSLGVVEGTTTTWALHLGDSFTDVPREHLFYPFVEALLHHGATTGCGAVRFCPELPESRAMMAMQVLRSRFGSGFTPLSCVEGEERFADVQFDDPFCPWIEELARREVVAGCGDGNYCPDEPVTRAQMAIFLLKTLEGPDYAPPGCVGGFADVPCPSPFADWIEELFRRGITAGCGASPMEYCPGRTITRSQCAVFQSKTFELSLYGL